MNNQCAVLATDLDGTFIPLASNQKNFDDLKMIQQTLQSKGIQLCFVTGRHYESVQQAMIEFHLPTPEWIICDVGTTIRRNSGGAFEVLEDYRKHLAELIKLLPVTALREQLMTFEGLTLQESEKQGEFKLSYYADHQLLTEHVAKIERLLSEQAAPYSIIHSVDPFNGDGLIDLLPKSVSKAYALDWWSRHIELPREAIIFAGDSGNDLAALTAGFRTILVGNAESTLVEQVRVHHQEQGWENFFYHAQEHATSGVLEGLRHFNMF